MKLRYDTSIPADPNPVVMVADDTRVEMHIRQDLDGTATLIALGGNNESPPSRTRQQGPYHRYDQAVAARRAVAAQLKERGFHHAPDEHPRWTMAAQRSINETRRKKAEFEADYRFDPKDVFLDW